MAKLKRKLLMFMFTLIMVVPIFTGCECTIFPVSELYVPEIKYHKDSHCITWKDVVNADGYTIYIDEQPVDNVFVDDSYESQTNFIYDLSSIINDTEKHKVNISAISNDKYVKDSVVSNEITYTNYNPEKKHIYDNFKVDIKNVNFKLVDDKITFTPIEEITKYKLFVYSNTTPIKTFEVGASGIIDLNSDTIKLSEKGEIYSLRLGYNDGSNDVLITNALYYNPDNYRGYTDNIVVFDGKIYDHYIEDLQELKKVVYHNFIYRDGDFNIKISDEFSEVIKDGFTGKSLFDKVDYAVAYGYSSFYETYIILPVDEITGYFSSVINVNKKEYRVQVNYGEYKESIDSNIKIIERYQQNYQPYYEKVNYKMWKDSGLQDSEKFVSDSFYLQTNVETTEELYWAIENKTTPIFNSNTCNAKIVYDDAKKILNEIISNEMTDYEKVLSIFDYICVNTVYDTFSLDIEDPSSVPAYYLDGVFLTDKKQAVCDGFSKTFSLLTNMIGIDSIRVVGDASTGESYGGHAWNKVFLDVDKSDDVGEECYLVDLTWTEIHLTNYDEQSTHSYFLLSDEDVKDSHVQYKYRPEFQVYKSETNYNYYRNFTYSYKEKTNNLIIDEDEDFTNIFYHNLDNSYETFEMIVDYEYMVSVYEKLEKKVYEPTKDYVYDSGYYSYYGKLKNALAEKMRSLKFQEQYFMYNDLGDFIEYEDGKKGLVFVMEQFLRIDDVAEPIHLVSYMSNNKIYKQYTLVVDKTMLAMNISWNKLTKSDWESLVTKLFKTSLTGADVTITFEYIGHDGGNYGANEAKDIFFDIQINKVSA